MKVVIKGVTFKIVNGEVPMEEAEAYVNRGLERYGDNLTEICGILDKDDPEMIDLEYVWKEKPFHRLRRITGYLVGNLSRWNNGKLAEERDRVKHSAEVNE